MQVQIAVEGEDAVAATDELFSMPEISGSWEPIGENEREAAIATVGTFVGVGGTIERDCRTNLQVVQEVSEG
ncbi:MAG: hypothetical protein KME43_14775 [Myxacorys chilensis ATA2-1-KO14]|jgi:hypothetical protein|nr:hypothetical protein [Myxacorys chilensis ATA2-1-KO14]